MVGAKPLIIESTRLPLSTDGKTLNTTVLQSAIDRIAHHRQGGTLILHKGTYLTGMLHMRSNVELHLMPGAVLLGSTSPYDYDEPGSAAQVGEKSRTALLVASGQHNISITGKGVIDGQGLELALTIDSLHHIGERIDPNYNQRRMRPNARPKLFFFDRCAPGNILLAQLFHERGVLVYYEPNEPVDRNFLRAVAASDIVKFSNEKHPDVSFTEGFTDKLFIQTLNEKGLRFKLRSEGWITIPPEHNPHAVDGEGAGDWTTSAFINEMGHHHMLTFDRIHLPNVTHCLEEAQRVASQSVSYIGAKGLIHH